jgi:hypothetical protein
MKILSTKTLLLFVIFILPKDVYCQNLGKTISEIKSSIESCLSNEPVKNYLFYVDSKAECYSVFRLLRINQIPTIISYNVAQKKLPEQLKNEIVDYDENLFTEIILFAFHSEVQNNSKSPKANKSGCFTNRNSALNAISDNDFSGGSGNSIGYQFYLFFGYDQMNNNVRLLTPNQESLAHKIINSKNKNGENCLDKIKSLKAF